MLTLTYLVTCTPKKLARIIIRSRQGKFAANNDPRPFFSFAHKRSLVLLLCGPGQGVVAAVGMLLGLSFLWRNFTAVWAPVVAIPI